MKKNSRVIRKHDIAIYGAGGLGREVALMIGQINAAGAGAWKMIGFFDDGKDSDQWVDGYRVLGGIDALNRVNKKLSIIVAIADPAIRMKLVSTIKNAKIEFPIMIHPSVIRGSVKFNSFGKGNIITAGNIFTTNIKTDDFVIINLSCKIGHDVTIASFSSIMPGCNISGNVQIGEQVYFGTGASILPNLTVGNNAVIGAGAVVTRNVEEGVTVIGVPAK